VRGGHERSFIGTGKSGSERRACRWFTLEPPLFHRNHSRLVSWNSRELLLPTLPPISRLQKLLSVLVSTHHSEPTTYHNPPTHITRRIQSQRNSSLPIVSIASPYWRPILSSLHSRLGPQPNGHLCVTSCRALVHHLVSRQCKRTLRPGSHMP
jgi:hypothetical protein